MGDLILKSVGNELIRPVRTSKPNVQQSTHTLLLCLTSCAHLFTELFTSDYRQYLSQKTESKKKNKHYLKFLAEQVIICSFLKYSSCLLQSYLEAKKKNLETFFFFQRLD